MKFLVAVTVCVVAQPLTGAHPPSPDVIWQKFDEYSKLSFTKQKRRLANFIIQMRAERGAVAYVISYAGRMSCPNEAQSRANRVSSYLVSAGQLDPNRIKIIDAGYHDDWVIELWIAPQLAPPMTKQLISQTDGHLATNEVRVVASCGSRRSQRNSKRRRA